MRTVLENHAETLEFTGGAAADQAAAARADTRTRAALRFALLLAVVWIALDICYTALPLIRPGADIVLAAKFDTLARGRMFSSADRIRIFVFGNSKTMAGFLPEAFDDALPGGVRSYNLGLPGEARFMPILKTALASGNIPTHVFLTLPWDGHPRPPTLLDRLRDDETILYALVPFRDLPRDAATFLAGSHFHFHRKYDDAAQERQRMLDQRGWYFIKSQSLFPDDRLPDGYALPTDHPAEFIPRALPARSYMREELESLALQYHFTVVLIPDNLRSHARAAAPRPDADRDVALPCACAIRVIGPDYWVYPPAYFSDPVHMNPRGAVAYTRDLAVLLDKSGVLN